MFREEPYRIWRADSPSSRRTRCRGCRLTYLKTINVKGDVYFQLVEQAKRLSTQGQPDVNQICTSASRTTRTAGYTPHKNTFNLAPAGVHYTNIVNLHHTALPRACEPPVGLSAPPLLPPSQGLYRHNRVIPHTVI